jgi:hypothetical protein
MDAAETAVLQNVVRKEGRSLLQYVGESFPWTTAQNHHVLPVLFEMVKEEQQGVTAVVAYLLKQRKRPPYLGAYPMSFTTINFMSLDFLLPYLIDFEKRRIADLENNFIMVTEDEPKHILKSLLDVKKRHLATLMEITGPKKDAA